MLVGQLGTAGPRRARWRDSSRLITVRGYYADPCGICAKLKIFRSNKGASKASGWISHVHMQSCDQKASIREQMVLFPGPTNEPLLILRTG